VEAAGLADLAEEVPVVAGRAGVSEKIGNREQGAGNRKTGSGVYRSEERLRR
jgi:hypothetical protein